MGPGTVLRIFLGVSSLRHCEFKIPRCFGHSALPLSLRARTAALGAFSSSQTWQLCAQLHGGKMDAQMLTTLTAAYNRWTIFQLDGGGGMWDVMALKMCIDKKVMAFVWILFFFF